MSAATDEGFNQRALIDALPWPVTTERLSIRPAEVDDADAVWAYRQIPDVTEWMSSLNPDLGVYAAKFEDPEWRSKMLVIERDGVLIGDLYVSVEDPWSQTEVKEQAARSQAEIGWALHPDRQGRGYAVEAVRELLRICFDAPPRGLGLRRVVALCFADNEPSWRLMERVGMRREAHTVADNLHRDGRWYDGMTYALLAKEWRATSG
jgi:RimJ/RimL family protein N-acetyltransferase